LFITAAGYSVHLFFVGNNNLFFAVGVLHCVVAVFLVTPVHEVIIIVLLILLLLFMVYQPF
jgi:hypothetical protein